jgi:16S rRNA (uracil1498-N3)-methyltransferase
MTRRRWIADEVSGNSAALTGEHAAHLARVLRAEIGQEFDIATGDTVRRGTITSVSDDRVEFALGQEQAVKPAPQITLVLAIFKFDRMEWAIEKCTEIGVARIIPVIARRTETHLAAAAVKRHERWQRIALQAAEQSRRPSPPEIVSPVKLKDIGSAGVPPASPPGDEAIVSRIVLAESEDDTTLRDVLQSRPRQVTLAVGPEGGWAPDELQWFHDSGWTAASLGDTILRAETAAIVSAAIAVDALR